MESGKILGRALVFGLFLCPHNRICAQSTFSTNANEGLPPLRRNGEVRKDGSIVTTNLPLPTTVLGVINPGGANVLHSEVSTNAQGAGNKLNATGSGAFEHDATNTANGELNNTAYGLGALFYTTTGGANTAAGVRALQANTSGFDNTADGYQSLASSTTGNYNTAVGANALANSAGNHNIALGAGAGRNVTFGDNNIEIDDTGQPGDSGVIRIGTPSVQNSAYIVGIFGTTIPTGAPVFINSSGQLGTLTSSRRFKEAIQDMGDASEALLSLQPVTFHYKPQIDPAETLQFGLVAEDVDRVNPDLVIRDDKRDIYTVRYEAINAMLLNEFLKEHKKVQLQEQRLAAQDAELKELKQRLEKLERLVEKDTNK
jgi:hypothetical protein